MHLFLLAVHDVSSVHAHERVSTHALLRAFRHRCHENQSEDDGWHQGKCRWSLSPLADCR